MCFSWMETFFWPEKRKKKWCFSLQNLFILICLIKPHTHKKNPRHEKQIELNLAADDSLSRRLALSHSFPKRMRSNQEAHIDLNSDLRCEQPNTSNLSYL